MRRMGAQYYARRGVPLAVIQHIGRWGSATVLKYVDQALEGRASWAPVVAAEGLGGEGLAVGGGVAVRHTALEAGSAGRTTRLGGRLPPGERRRTLAPPRPPVPTDPGALGSAIFVGSGSAWPACPGGGRGRPGLAALASGPPPGGSPGSACPGGGRGGLGLEVLDPEPPPGGGLGPGGGWEPVGCPRCAGPAGACPSVAGRVAIKSGATGVGHWVQPGRDELHPLAWVTLCGWHFGAAPHARCCACETSCKRCLQAASCQVGGAGRCG